MSLSLYQLKKHLEKEERDQRSKKQKKYNRDNYKANLVFNWQKKLIADQGLPNSNVPLEHSEPITQNPDRRLTYEPPPSTPAFPRE